MDGEVVNLSEKRAALHTLLRSSNSPLPQYSSVLVERNRMLDFADKVRNGAWRGFSGKRILNVINIGIGGSETGVRAVYHALVKGDETIRLHFLSVADGIRLDRVLGQCDPRSTLVVVSSKTFTTRETLANARSVDAWFAKHGIVGERRHHHIVCVSANENAADLMGVPQSNLLVHLGSPWNAALTFKKKSGRLPPRKKVALTPNFRQIQVTREEPRKKDERYDQYCRATFQISRSMARLPDHFFQDSSLARRWQEDSKEALQKPSLILRLENFHLLHRLNYCTNDCSGYF